MRYLILTTIIAAGLIACNQSVKIRNGVILKSASEYNNYIIERQSEIGVYITSFFNQLNTNPDSAGAIIEKSLSGIDRILEEVKGMPSYKGDTSFRNAAIGSFGFYKRLFEDDYPRILALRLKKDTMTMKWEDQQAEQEILNKIIVDEEAYDKKLHNTQKDFADKNNMKLMVNEKQKKRER